MKRKLLTMLLIASIAASPVTAFADEKDDRIAELESEVLELQQTITELEAKIKELTPAATDQDTYHIGETWVVPGQWKLTIDSVEETADRNEYADRDAAAVYIVTYTYENIGFTNEYSDGLFFVMDDNIVDATGKMGFAYPGDVNLYAEEVPVGAYCQAQVCIGVDNPGDFQINVTAYDGNDTEQTANFTVTVE